MRCKQCDYPLWDLPTRLCPECGTPFAPSHYTFIPNSVRFLCVTCRQPYYGTSASGHLQPAIFNCVSCGTHLNQDDMILLPTQGVTEDQTIGGVIPWRKRAERGRVQAFFSTLAMAAFTPQRLARYAGNETRPGDAILFAALCITLIVFCTIAPILLLGSAFSITSLGQQASMIDIWLFARSILLNFALPCIAVAAFVLFWVTLAHVIIATGNTRPAPFNKTIESFSYAMGAGFIAALPCFGMFLSPLAIIWVAISAAIQLSNRQQASSLRITFAVISAPLILLLAFVAFITLSP